MHPKPRTLEVFAHDATSHCCAQEANPAADVLGATFSVLMPRGVLPPERGLVAWEWLFAELELFEKDAPLYPRCTRPRTAYTMSWVSR